MKQVVRITVDGEYNPAIVRLKKNVPVQLIFERRDPAFWSGEVVLPEFGIRRPLPPFRQTTIEVNPSQTGIFNFRCGRDMLHGRVVVEE
jgi:P-type Cu+ transporter